MSILNAMLLGASKVPNQKTKVYSLVKIEGHVCFTKASGLL